MPNTEPLVNDGAPYKCGYLTGYDFARDSETCDKRAVVALTKSYFEEHRTVYAFRAVCKEHVPQ